MYRRKLLLIASALSLIFLLSSLAPGQNGQTTAQKTEQAPPPQAKTEKTSGAQDEPAEETADLVIIANVTAKELKFEVVPNPDVKFTGKPESKTLWKAERQNLPEQVQPGVTYRNIGIRLKIVSRLGNIEQIVAEALGETPITDDVPPPAENRAPAQASPQPANTKQTPSPATATSGKGKPK